MKLKEYYRNIRNNNEFVKQGGSLFLAAIQLKREGYMPDARDYFNKVLKKASEISTFLGKHRNQEFEVVKKHAEQQRYLKALKEVAKNGPHKKV